MNDEIPFNPPGMDEYIREGARKNQALLRKMQGQPVAPETVEAKPDCAPATGSPAVVYPVAEFILEEMEARGWTKDDLLDRMPGQRDHNSLWLDLIFDAPQFDLETRRNLRLGDPTPLAKAFGTSNELWTNLDEAWVKQQNTEVSHE